MDIKEDIKIHGLTTGNGKRNKSTNKSYKTRRYRKKVNIIDEIINKSDYFLELKFKYDIPRKIGIKDDKFIQKFWDITFIFVALLLSIINIIILVIYKFGENIRFMPVELVNFIDKEFIIYKAIPLSIFFISIVFILWVDLEEGNEI